jgi:hypothetical protein
MLDLVIANGWLTLDRSGTFVKFAPSGRLTNCFWTGMLITPPIACSWQRRRPIANLAPFLRMAAEWLKPAEAPID